MPDFEMDFEWPVSNYRLVAAEEWDRITKKNEFRAKFLEIRGRPDPDDVTPDWQIVPDGPAVTKRPTAKQLDSALDLLVLQSPEKFKETALRVAQHLGMLGRGRSESVEQWSRQARVLRLILSQDKLRESFKAERFKVADMDLMLLTKSGRPAQISFQPRTLADALNFHAARRSASGTHISTCEQCSAVMLVGGTRAGNRKKNGARFCSNICRANFHNARR